MDKYLQPNTRELVAAIENLTARHSGNDWIESLDPRKQDEAQFHDIAREDTLDSQEAWDAWLIKRPNMKFYATNKVSLAHRIEWIERNAPGRVFLDYACGRGSQTLHAASVGAALSVGIDISPTSIQKCHQTAEQAGLVQNTRFVVTDCEATELPDNSFDRIITAGCLHHLDLNAAFPELYRILKPGGRIYAIEALAYNPLIRLYRRLTPSLRTEFEREHILSMREVRLAEQLFQVKNIKFFHLTSIAVTPFRKFRFFPALLRLANFLDSIILKYPPMCYLAWQFSFEMVKGPSDEQK